MAKKRILASQVVRNFKKKAQKIVDEGNLNSISIVIDGEKFIIAKKKTISA